MVWGNNKLTSADKYHHLKIFIQAIIGQDRGTHVSILQSIKTTQCDWNIAPIDVTEVLLCVDSVGRELKYPWDVDIGSVPTIYGENHSILSQYLWDVYNN